MRESKRSVNSSSGYHVQLHHQMPSSAHLVPNVCVDVKHGEDEAAQSKQQERHRNEQELLV